MAKRKNLEDYLIEKKKYQCNRCYYNWDPKKNRKKNGKPQTCPKCRSRYWDKPRKF